MKYYATNQANKYIIYIIINDLIIPACNQNSYVIKLMEYKNILYT